MKLLFVILMPYMMAGSVFSEESFSFGGFGDGVHNYHLPDSPNGQVLSLLKKNKDTYKYIWSNEKNAILSKNDGEIKIDIGYEFGINSIALTFLADVLETENGIILLFVTAQAYLYIELVNSYPVIKLPPGEVYLNFPDKFEGRKWKPYKYVSFVPKGMHATNFLDEIKAIKSISIESPGKLKIVRDEHNYDSYMIAEESIESNGGYYKPLDYKYKRKLESEFIAKINDATDDSLFRETQNLVTGDGKELKSPISNMLDSMKNREMAERIKSRILKLHAEKKSKLP